MKLWSGLVIQDQKLTEYLLVYQHKDDKSGFLALAGYTIENWRQLKQDRLNAVASSEVAEVIDTHWGTRFKVKSQWNGLNDRPIRVVTLWQQDEGSDKIRFVTLYPDKSPED